jgi:haloacetate dehalogenase
MWHRLADDLASKFTVIVADLRGECGFRYSQEHLLSMIIIGYGQSSKPPGSQSHVEYSKKVMAADQVTLMFVSVIGFHSNRPQIDVFPQEIIWLQ